MGPGGLFLRETLLPTLELGRTRIPAVNGTEIPQLLFNPRLLRPARYPLLTATDRNIVQAGTTRGGHKVCLARAAPTVNT